MAAPGYNTTLEQYTPVVQEQGLNTLKNINFNSGSNTCDLPASTTIDGAAVAGIGNITSSSTSAVAFSVTNSGVYAGTGVVTITANSLTTGVALLVTGSGVIATTGKLVSIVGTGLTTGTALSLGTLAGLTTGFGISIAHTTSAIASGGSLLNVTSTSTDTGTTTGTLANLSSAAGTAQNLVLISDAALLTGTMLNLNHTAGVIASGGSLLRIRSATIDVGTTTGTMLDLAATAATTGTLIKVVSATLTSGKALVFTLAGLTTGAAIDTTGLAAATQNFNMNASAGSTAAPQTNAPAGFFKVGIGGTDQWIPYYGSS